MDYELFKKIIDEASLYGPRSFSLHLFGEPLLWGRICEGILYIKKRNKRHTVILTTNGILLNEFADKLLECGVDKIIWTYRRLGRNKFTDKTLHSLRKIATLRILKETMQEEDWNSVKSIPWKREIKEIHNYGGNIKNHSKYDSRYPCYHLWLNPAIRFNGDVTICCNDPNGASIISKNINGSSLHDVWVSDYMSNLRREQRLGIYTGICKDCDVWKTYPSIW